MSDFSGMTKHVGILNNTGKNVVVVFMRLPGDPNNSLVVDTDALPDQYNESLRKIVESVEGQQSKDLAEVLGRRMSPDGSNMTLLEKFHAAGRLEKVPVKLVTMTPRKGIRWPLEQVLQAMDAAKADDPVGFDDLDPETKAAVAADLKRFNVHANNMQGEASANSKEQAVSLIRQAELMEADAQNMRMKAYKIDPSLAPKTKKGPALDQAYEVKQIKETIVVPTSDDSLTKAEVRKPVNAKKSTTKPAKKVSA
jgi:hypothetical protein